MSAVLSFPIISFRWQSAIRVKMQKLAAGLTGYKIDIISESAAKEMPEEESESSDSEQE